MSDPKLLTISGSLRKGSFNRMLLREAVTAFGPADVTGADLHLPLYDGDLEETEGIPAAVTRLTDQISDADAVVISTPEYNKGIPGVLKNALDWSSRVKGAPFRNKPTVVISASAGRTGGETGQFMTLSCLTQLQAHLLPGPSVLVAGAQDQFDDSGRLANDLYLNALKTRMEGLRAFVTGG